LDDDGEPGEVEYALVISLILNGKLVYYVDYTLQFNSQCFIFYFKLFEKKTSIQFKAKQKKTSD